MEDAQAQVLFAKIGQQAVEIDAWREAQRQNHARIQELEKELKKKPVQKPKVKRT